MAKITSEQIAQFKKQGYLYIPNALDKKAVKNINNHITNQLKQLKIWSTGRHLSQRFSGVPLFQQVAKLGQMIDYPELKDKLITKELYDFMNRLSDMQLKSSQAAQLLITLPENSEWSLQGLNWHRDISHSQLDKSHGVQIFILLDDLDYKGGATLAIAGSHNLKNKLHEKEYLSRLADDRELSILEMVGKAGDIYIMDMRLLHTPSMNSSKKVRMMATIRYFI